MTDQIQLLPLTDDFVFKKVFSSNEHILLDFLNSFFENVDLPKIDSIEILNPESFGDHPESKGTILDIRARDEQGNGILIEMQATSQAHFGNRILFYTAGVVRESLTKGNPYREMKQTISINILNFNWTEYPEMISQYSLRNQKHPENQLTDRLFIYLIELKKGKDLEFTQSFQNWLDLFTIRRIDMATKIIPNDHPALQMALEELEKISGNQEYRNIYEMRLKAKIDYEMGMVEARKQGKEEGEKIGLEKGEEIGLEKGGILALVKIGKTPPEIAELLNLPIDKVLSILENQKG